MIPNLNFQLPFKSVKFQFCEPSFYSFAKFVLAKKGALLLKKQFSAPLQAIERNKKCF